MYPFREVQTKKPSTGQTKAACFGCHLPVGNGAGISWFTTLWLAGVNVLIIGGVYVSLKLLRRKR